MFTNDTDDNDLPNQFNDIPVETLINTEVEEHELNTNLTVPHILAKQVYIPIF